MHDYLVIVVIVVIAVLFIIYRFFASYKRRQELANWALSKGLFFIAGKDSSFDSKYPGFDCLQKGHDRYACNVIKGDFAGREFVGCDYHYVTGYGKSSREYDISLVIIKSPILLEPLLIRPETFSDKLAELVGFSDIDFESAEFSKKFYVKSPDKKWAYDIIHPRMMEFLMNSPEFSIQFDSLSVIVYRDTRFSPAEFEDAANLANGIFERIPDYVVQNQRIRPA
ncbi:MAG: hypothetical protein ABSB25_03340 [Sedimentisphaerales bacterium]|jgi:hypothetical protein